MAKELVKPNLNRSVTLPKAHVLHHIIISMYHHLLVNISLAITLLCSLAHNTNKLIDWYHIV